MLRHKPRVDGEIPDFKGFLAYLNQVNPDLHGRYMTQVKLAFVFDTAVLCCFVGVVVVALVLLVLLATTVVLGTIVPLLVAFGILVGSMVACSVLGRKAHSNAVAIESEIVVEYHRSGFAR